MRARDRRGARAREEAGPHAHGSTTLDFQGQGFTGGCNAGHLLSWGGKVTVKVRLRRR